MPGLRKLRKKQKFKYDRNRKRVQKTQELTKNSSIKLADGVMKTHWDARKPVRQNLAAMGLAFDANQVMSLPSTKQQMVNRALGRLPEEEPTEAAPELSDVVQDLERQAEALKPTQPMYRLPKEEVRWITKMMDKHGDDFKAMARDPQNIWQLTPKQIRQKVVKFINIPEQFAELAKERGLLDDSQELMEQMQASLSTEK
eukprot:maker-scaffold80_size398941-snap-gene-1.13 protein:Tk02819 transcript:maker-scaffold80_size398941-snap-gene-1.13-mRNA-1 annotation:"nucleolar protein 16"